MVKKEWLSKNRKDRILNENKLQGNFINPRNLIIFRNHNTHSFWKSTGK